MLQSGYSPSFIPKKAVSSILRVDETAFSDIYFLMQHPLSAFQFCPHCGSEHFVVHDARAKRCSDCGFTYYCNASAATVAVVRNRRGQLLVVRRALDPARGTLDLPGGFVDPDESLEAGCLRELHEEVGLEGRIRRFLFSLPNRYAFGGHVVPTVDSFFEVEISDETALSAHDDAAEAFWLDPSDIDPAAFGLTSIAEGVRRFTKK